MSNYFTLSDPLTEEDEELLRDAVAWYYNLNDESSITQRLRRMRATDKIEVVALYQEQDFIKEGEK